MLLAAVILLSLDYAAILGFTIVILLVHVDLIEIFTELVRDLLHLPVYEFEIGRALFILTRKE